MRNPLLSAARVCWWTFSDPIRIERLVEATVSGAAARLGWCTLGGLAGLALALPVMKGAGLAAMLALPVLGVLLALVASGGFRWTDASDSIGMMTLSVVVLFLAFPANAEAAKVDQNWVAFVVMMVAVVALMALGWFLASVSNRGFMFWPLAWGGLVGLSSRGSALGLVVLLEKCTGPLPPLFLPALLVLILFTFRTQAASVVIRAYKYGSGTESYYALALVKFRRRVIVFYAVMALACAVFAFFYRGNQMLPMLAAVFLAGAVLELDPLQYVAVTLWVAAATARISRGGDPHRASPGGLLSTFPVLPFPPPGLVTHLRAYRRRRGNDAAAELVTTLWMTTGYAKAAERVAGEIGTEDPMAYWTIRQRLLEAVPDSARKGEQAEPEAKTAHAVSGAAPGPPLKAAGLFREEAPDEALDKFLFSHYYEPPRGKEGSPLGAFPIWFPVADPATETMTLKQVIYRTLGSVREPFRRTLIRAGDKDEAADLFTLLLDRAVAWSSGSFAATVLPIALSTSRMSERKADIAALADRTRAARAASPQTGASDRGDLLSACRTLLMWGAGVSEEQADQLTAALAAGNAWLLVEADTDEDDAAVRKLCDLVFGEAGLSHVAVISVASGGGGKVLSDMQAFSRLAPARTRPCPGKEKVPGRIAAALCRLCASMGTPPAMVTAVLTAVLATGMVAVSVMRYEAILPIVSAPADAAPSGYRWWLVAAGSVLVGVPFVTAYAVGLFMGSEELRRSSVEAVQTSLFGGMVSLLLLLPKSMSAGLLKSVVVGLLAIPGAALISVSILAFVSLLANLCWLSLSRRALGGLDRRSIAAAAEQFRVELHIAAHGTTIVLPGPAGARPTAPLLVCAIDADSLARVLLAFPRLSGAYVEMLMRGLKGEYSASSLIFLALQNKSDAVCERCLASAAEAMTREWPRRSEYGTYRKPSTSQEMNALEYGARRLCNLTNLEELVVVR